MTSSYCSNIIKMIRGDTYAFTVSILDEDSETGLYQLTAADKLYVGIMYPHQPFEDAIIKKRFLKVDQDSDGTIKVVITPEDTLDLFPGIYYYAVKLQKEEAVITVINKTKFIICD